MRHFLSRLLPWLSIAVCPPLLGHCGGAVEHGTETGNPPVVEQRKLHVVLHDDGVEVVGDPGAVSPGAQVVVTNTRTGDRAEAIAGSDGSVNVSVAGTLTDEYEVTVTGGGVTQTVRIAAHTSASGLDCESIEQELSSRVTAALGSADRSCQTDADCVATGAFSCYSSCERAILSNAGAAAAQQRIESEIEPLCTERSRQACDIPNGLCAALGPFGCVAGTCSVRELSCDEWRSNAEAEIASILQSAPRACSSDDDCALVRTNLACDGGCNVYDALTVPSSGAAPDDTLRRLEVVSCAQRRTLACPNPPDINCAALELPAKASCVAGACSVTSTP